MKTIAEKLKAYSMASFIASSSSGLLMGLIFIVFYFFILTREAEIYSLEFVGSMLAIFMVAVFYGFILGLILGFIPNMLLSVIVEKIKGYTKRKNLFHISIGLGLIWGATYGILFALWANSLNRNDATAHIFPLEDYQIVYLVLLSICGGINGFLFCKNIPDFRSHRVGKNKNDNRD